MPDTPTMTSAAALLSTHARRCHALGLQLYQHGQCDREALALLDAADDGWRAVKALERAQRKAEAKEQRP